MKHLVLIRHAKSSWADPGLEDADRPLNARGRMAAPVAGAWLAERAFAPDLVLCSPALRCRQTWERIAAQLDAPPAPEVVDALYMAEPDRMLEVLHQAPDTAGTLVMIGHQPGLSSFLRRLSDGSASSGCTRAYAKFPTASVALVDFRADHWADITFGSGGFHAFATPKDLV